MPAPGRPPPPITVVVPGRGPVPAELLAVGPPPERRPGLPGRLRALLVTVLLVLGAGVMVAVDQRADRSDTRGAEVSGEVPAASGAVAVGDFPGLRSTTQVVVEQTLAVQLLLEVRISAGPAPAVHERGSTRAVQVRLLQVGAEGFDVRLLQRPPPVLLGYVGRFGGGLEQVVRLSAEVVVAECAVAVAAPRRIRLDLRRGDRGEGPAGSVLVQSSAETVRALDELVRRSCRRPGG